MSTKELRFFFMKNHHKWIQLSNYFSVIYSLTQNCRENHKHKNHVENFPIEQKENPWSWDKCYPENIHPQASFSRKNSHEWIFRSVFFQKCTEKTEKKCFLRAARHCVMLLCCLFDNFFDSLSIKMKQTTIFSVMFQQNSARILIKTHWDYAMSQRFFCFPSLGELKWWHMWWLLNFILTFQLTKERGNIV